MCTCGITNEQDERDLREMLVDMAGTYGEPATPEEMEAMIQANDRDYEEGLINA